MGCGGSGGAAGGTADKGVAEAPSKATIAFAGKMISLDPDQAFVTTDVSAVHLIGGNLTELRRGGEIVPGLASSAKASAKGLRWTFTLRSGLTFSDGSPLTSADVKATFDRALGDKANIYAALFTRIDSIQAPDPTTVVINVKRPYPSIESVLAEPAFAIFPKDKVGTKGFFDAPVSAGPYRLVSWGGTETAVYAVNERYWGPKPKIAQVTFVTVPDPNTMLAQVKSGQLDLAVDLPPNLYDQITAPAHPHFSEIFGINSLIPRNDRKPFDEVGLRKAVSKAIDRAAITKTVFNDRVKPLAGFWPSTMTGYDANISTARDVEGAKADLKGTSCESGCGVTLMYNTTSAPAAQEALIVRSNLKDIGIAVKLEALDNTTFTTRLFAGKFQLALNPLYDYVDIPDGMLTYGLVSDGGIQANTSGLRSAEIDKTAAVAMEASGDRRTEAMAEIERQFAQEAPYANLTAHAVLQAARLSDDLLTLDASGTIEIARAG